MPSTSLTQWALCLLLLAVSGPAVHGSEQGELGKDGLLYFGNLDTDNVGVIDVNTGKYVNENFAIHPAPNIISPLGMLFKGNSLTVSYQNGFLGTSGDIAQFNRNTGAFQRILVGKNSRHAAYAPRGMVWIPENLLVVCDTIDFDDENTAPGTAPGRLRIHDYSTGKFIRALTAPVMFNPRGIVYNDRDKKLYVTSGRDRSPNNPGLGGSIFRFDPVKGFEKVITTSQVIPNFNRPDGIVLDNNNNLWVSAFRTDTTDIDRIYRMTTQGRVLEVVPLPGGENRYFAQTIRFGPGGYLYLMNAQGKGVRKYDTKKKQFYNVFDGISGWAFTFAKTNPSTLKYED